MKEHDNSVINVVPLKQPRIVQSEQRVGFEIEVSINSYFVDVILTKLSDEVWHYFLTLRLLYPQEYKEVHVVSFIGYSKIGKDNRLKWQTYIKAHPGLLGDNDARVVFIECRNACQNRLSQIF